ncbi:MAG: hypothetical protein P1P90_05010 [Patescibacteria group bacterium]|nr:hypothetical protein [Patescibacteria group bacterium]
MRKYQLFITCLPLVALTHGGAKWGFLMALGIFATGCWSTNTMSSEVNGRKTMETRAEYGPWGSDLHVKRDTSRYEAYKAEIGDLPGDAEDSYARERIHAEERTRIWGNTPYAGFYNGCLGQYGMSQTGYCDGRTREYESCLNRLGQLPGGEEKSLCMEQVMVRERRSTWGQPAYYGGGGYLSGY